MPPDLRGASLVQRGPGTVELPGQRLRSVPVGSTTSSLIVSDSVLTVAPARATNSNAAADGRLPISQAMTGRTV